MSWFRSGLHSISISDWLTLGPSAPAASAADLDDARDALLGVLGEKGQRTRATLALRIRTAKDAAGLWALRAEVMTAACQLHGEAEANSRMRLATSSFDGLLPAALAPRRSVAAGVSR